MKIILTDDVVGLGDIGETVSVKPGYARNFLIPRGFAIESGSNNARAIAHRMLQIDAKKRRMKGDAESRAAGLRGKTIKIELRTGAHNRTFGSVTSKEIVAKLAELGFELDRRRVQLAEPIKKVGEYLVNVKLHQDVATEIKVVVVSRDSSTAEENADVDGARRAIEAGAAARQQAAESEAADADSSDDEEDAE